MLSTPAAYLRQPSLHGDTVVFVSDDDLWRVSTAGGAAQRLTAGLSEPATPCLSPDGRWLAYAGSDEKHAEVWLMPAAGGSARRLTWLGSELAVRGWTPEGRIVFCSNHGQPFYRNWHAWTIAPEGGVPERVPLGQINHLSFDADGRRAIGRNTADPARWKRYRGGTAGHLWVEAAAGSGQFTRLDGLRGNLSCPMWVGGRLYFIGDADGCGNLHSCRADGSDLRSHTTHTDFYVRHASSDGERIVYQCGADLWLFDPKSGRTRLLAIEVASSRTQAARRFVDAADNLQGMALHPQGHSVALEVRGHLVTMPLWEGAVHLHGNTGGRNSGRQRLGQWLADGSTLIATSDASGEERVVAISGLESRELPWLPESLGRVTALRAAPVGTRVAIANHRNQLWVGDVATGTLALADHSEFGRIEDPAWSPCGGWLAYTYATSNRHTAVKLHQVEGGVTLLATQPEFHDFAPAFDPEGRYLYFLSLRTFDPVYDSVQFELSFPRAARPYLIALQAGGPAPFEPLPKGFNEAGKAEAEARRGDANPAALPAIDTEGLARRVAAFPVPEGRFGQIAGVANGKVIWTALPIVGAHGRGGHKDTSGKLEVWDFEGAQRQTLLAEADHFVLAADHRSLLVRSGKQLRAIDATRKPEDDKRAERDPAKPSRQSGIVDLSRVRLAVSPSQEWAQLLREVWRLQRDHFWSADMSGIGWPSIYERYAPLLPRVATRGELSDLIWELQGELGTSHAYEMGGDHRKAPAVALGHLAAEFRPPAPADADAETEAGWEIVRTVQGDAWDTMADSPLNAVGVQAQPGERVVAVGGQPTTSTLPPQALLVHQAGATVALRLADAAGKQRDVLVKALADEVPARYREWVERNRAWVHESSGGRVGYFHLPDMMSSGFAEFHRYFADESDRDGLIVDVRYNRGGHVSELLLEKVARKRIAWNVQRWGQPSCYPEAAPAGPVVALTNEHAGSDGDIFSHAFKLMNIGTLVGQRTWGGVIGIWPRHKLADGTETTQPEYSFWFKDAGWAVENYGTDPQVVVANAPQDDAFNAPERDRQLQTALDEVLKAIEREGVYSPDFGPRPQLGR
ncbi:MAG: S41 family peptidase [Pseudomonadota bacterium]|nr:S41 family peptidase [Pseudomonadota bacterium]